MAVNQPKKKQSLRNNEYYNTQELFDDLYKKSQHGEIFTQLWIPAQSECPSCGSKGNVPCEYLKIPLCG
jgi:hypothetical protein